MQLDNEPIEVAPGDFVSYPSDGGRPYDLLEVYHNTDGTQDAALICWVTFDSYLPRKLRWRKRRKFIEAKGAATLEHTVRQHFPTGRYVDTDEGALVEFLLPLPEGVQPIPVRIEERLLTETPAADLYHQVHAPDSPLSRELRHRFYLASVGTEWQKYFPHRSV